MRARKVAILLLITALSELTLCIILLADTDALGTEASLAQDSVTQSRLGTNSSERQIAVTIFKSSRVLEAQIDEFLDTVGEGGLVYQTGVKAYLKGESVDFEAAIASIAKLESQADKISKNVESHLYRQSLIPEHRGDVLGLLENTDNIIDTTKMSLFQFSVEQPDIPAEFDANFMKLTDASAAAVEAVIVCARAFFRDAELVKDNLYKVHHYEQEADNISDSLKRAVFASDLDLAHKIHLRYFALNVEKVSDKAQEVADRLAIYSIKRNI